jgi:hypothetical protein
MVFYNSTCTIDKSNITNDLLIKMYENNTLNALNNNIWILKNETYGNFSLFNDSLDHRIKGDMITNLVQSLLDNIGNDIYDYLLLMHSSDEESRIILYDVLINYNRELFVSKMNIGVGFMFDQIGIMSIIKIYNKYNISVSYHLLYIFIHEKNLKALTYLADNNIDVVTHELNKIEHSECSEKLYKLLLKLNISYEDYIKLMMSSHDDL